MYHERTAENVNVFGITCSMYENDVDIHSNSIHFFSLFLALTLSLFSERILKAIFYNTDDDESGKNKRKNV